MGNKYRPKCGEACWLWTRRGWHVKLCDFSLTCAIHECITDEYCIKALYESVALLLYFSLCFCMYVCNTVLSTYQVRLLYFFQYFPVFFVFFGSDVIAVQYGHDVCTEGNTGVLLPNLNLLVSVSNGMWAVKYQQNLPVLNCGCRLTEVHLFNGSKMVIVAAAACLLVM